MLLLLLMCAGQVSTYAQNNYEVKGFVLDTASTIKLVNSSVSVLNSKDSTLVKFTRVANTGMFNIGHLPKGKFILLVTYPGYADYVENFSLDSLHRQKDFGKLNLSLLANLLSNVIITGNAGAIRIKGDTTEYNPESYVIKPNSKVEDLLKQLPGIQVDKDGKITAQGKKVNKVLVDGEEFFGDDPTLVTKNVRGDMVAKVQVYDKKSDQATFTGVDDGVKNKTINIQIKEDKKNGYFGKLSAGIGTGGNYESQGTFNAFKKKRKIGVYGGIGNTGRDRSGMQMGGDMEMMSFGDVSVAMPGGGDDMGSFDGGYNGEGIPFSRSAGAHYDGKWNKDKESINSNYMINAFNVDGTRNTLSQNNLPTGMIKSSSDETFNNYAFKQKLDGKYIIKLDSMSTLRVGASGTLKNNETNSSYQTSSSRANETLLNTSNRTVNNKGEEKAFNGNLFWNKRFKRKGRSLSLDISEKITQNDSKGFLESENAFYNEKGVLMPDSTKKVNQYKTNHSRNAVFKSNLTYSESIIKNLAVVFNYGLGINNNIQDRKSFNADGAGKYTLLDSVYSNSYKFDQLTNQGGMIFNFKFGKGTLNAGTRVTAVTFKQVDLYTNKSVNRDFVNWNPQLNYQNSIGPQKYLTFSYNGSTSQPSIDQIQPVRVNTDPLNITLGNPGLKPSFSNNFNASYNSFKMLSSKMIRFDGSYSFTANPIVSNTVTDTSGKSTFQSINLTGKTPSNYSVSASMNNKIKALDLNVGIGLTFSGSNSYSLSNDVLNTSKSNSYSGNFSISKYDESKFSFMIDFGPNYNTNRSSLQKIPNDGWGFMSNAQVSYVFPWKIELTSDANYEYRGKTASFNENFSRLIWNASVTKKFFKSENLSFSISGRDLLNQNSGFNRTASGNMITQNSFTTIKRYFMCSLIWDFNKMGITKDN